MVRPLKRIILLLPLLLLASPLFGQQSPFLQNPDLFIDYVDTNANFWLSAYDDVSGGFYTNISREGNLISAWGQDKDVLTQSRNAYAMIRAFQMTGDKTFLAYSRGALDFMYEHGWDQTYGGWRNDLSRLGNSERPTDSKTAFIHHYALLGPMASWEATGAEIDWQWLQTGRVFNETKIWDSNPSQFGYFDQIDYTSTFAGSKSFNATVDALTTHAIQLYLATGEEQYRVRLVELASNILDHLVASMDSQAIGFAEKYTSDWSIRSNERLTIMGHVLKTAWVLGRINQVLPNTEYLAAAKRLTDHVLEKGYDHEYGGPYKDYDRISGKMQLWGIADSTKAWWQMEQAITGGLELYRSTRDATYLTMADETLTFFMNHFQDDVYGEVYADRTRYGAGIPQWGNHKGDSYKAAYHSIELGYYAYLYTHLFVTYTPATLYYFFDPSEESRTFILSPLEDLNAGYIISSVLLDGDTYRDFTTETRTLTVPAGTTGVFKVEFSPTTSIAVEHDVPEQISLNSVYPNPASNSVTAELTIPKAGMVTVSLVDVLGRTVLSKHQNLSHLGTHRLRMETAWLPAGVYSLVVQTTTNRLARQLVLVQ